MRNGRLLEEGEPEGILAKHGKATLEEVLNRTLTPTLTIDALQKVFLELCGVAPLDSVTESPDKQLKQDQLGENEEAQVTEIDKEIYTKPKLRGKRFGYNAETHQPQQQ